MAETAKQGTGASPAKPAAAASSEKPAAAAAASPKTGAPEKAEGKAAVPPAEAQKEQPGIEALMKTKPVVIHEDYKGSGKMEGLACFVTGGDSGIGRSAAVHFAREGADVGILYLSEDQDAQETEAMVKAEGRRCLVFKGDAGDPAAVSDALTKTIEAFGRLDVLVANAAEQHQRGGEWPDVDPESLRRVLKTNAEGYFLAAQCAVKAGAFKHGEGGGSIIFTSSVVAFSGSSELLDYSATKGFEVTLMRSLAKRLAKDKIRVNCVAPGPIWTPLIPATFSKDQIGEWAAAALMGRPGQPSECGPAFVLLASRDGSFMTGSTIHVNGGQYMA